MAPVETAEIHVEHSMIRKIESPKLIQSLDLSSRVPGHTVIVRMYQEDEQNERWEFWIDGTIHYSGQKFGELLQPFAARDRKARETS